MEFKGRMMKVYKDYELMTKETRELSKKGARLEVAMKSTGVEVAVRCRWYSRIFIICELYRYDWV